MGENCVYIVAAGYPTVMIFIGFVSVGVHNS